MSRRYRKRREERILNSELITESAPRGLTQPLPLKPAGRVRPVYDTQPLDRQFGDLPRIDSGKIVQDLRRLHIEHDIRYNQVDSRGIRYDYRRENVGRDETVYLPSSHPICQEREERREILFARRKAGKRGQKTPIIRLTVKCEKRRK